MSGRTSAWLGISLIAAVIVLAVAVATAGIPKKINYQGRLVASASGLPLAGSHNVTFRIYLSAEGGDAVWTESKAVVADSLGVFSTVIGSDQVLSLQFGWPCWLEVEVDGEVLSPRREMVSTPYAFHAMNADSVPALRSSGTINDAGNPVDWTKLKNVPPDLADGIDDVGGASDGYSLDAADGSPTDAVYVDNDGRVGVGTTSPGDALDVVGSINLAEALKIGGSTAVRVDSLSTSVGRDAGPVKAGDSNTFVGGRAGYSVLSGDGNTFLGAYAGQADASGSVNTFVGTGAGMNNVTGTANTFVGGAAGIDNTNGWHGTFIGMHAGTSNTSGSSNVFIGSSAGYGNSTGADNTCIGAGSGYASGLGSQNTFMGAGSGGSNAGSGNVFLGYRAGYYETGSNTLYVANGQDTRMSWSTATSPLAGWA